MLTALLCLYFFLAIPCYITVYYRGADADHRIHYQADLWSTVKQVLFLIKHDFFEVYCPWSWRIAREHRLVDLRVFLGANGRQHERFGLLTVADCDNPEKQEAIARHCYINRIRFWSKIPLHFLASPLIVTVFLVLLAIEDLCMAMRL
jgi:hypothetical protein